MNNSILRAILVTGLAFSTEAVMEDRPTVKPFTQDEAKPLLETLSKLHSLVLVEPSRYFPIPAGWPHICWLATPELGVLNTLVPLFRGSNRWVLISDMPRECLVAKMPEGAPDPSEPTWPRFVESFQASAVAELPAFAGFIEKSLNLSDKRSLGIALSNDDLELPLIEDRLGPGRFSVVTADPDKYATNPGMPTSPFDRTLHFWITEDEYDDLYAEIEKSSDANLLRRIAEGSYQNVVIEPEEVGDLASECTRLEGRTSNARLVGALRRIRSVCTSAKNYKLGICIPGG
jgi:hypothetical protein